MEIVEFYADFFCTDKPEIILFGETLPEQEAANQKQSEKLVIHADLESEETRVLFSDIPPQSPEIKGTR